LPINRAKRVLVGAFSPWAWFAEAVAGLFRRRGEPTILGDRSQHFFSAAARVLALSALLLAIRALPPAQAQNGSVSERWPEEDPPPTMAPAELGDALHAGRNFLGRPVDELAQALDWFFDDERVEDEADGRLRLGTSLLLEPSGTSGLETDVSLSINLPRNDCV
jgi:hypothetical protein